MDNIRLAELGDRRTLSASYELASLLITGARLKLLCYLPCPKPLPTPLPKLLNTNLKRSPCCTSWVRGLHSDCSLPSLQSPPASLLIIGARPSAVRAICPATHSR
jgi:hypothetical protein